MESMILLDEIEEKVDEKYENFDKSVRSMTEFTTKINELEDYKYLLFKAREVFHSKSSFDSDIDFDKHSLEQMRLANISGVL